MNKNAAFVFIILFHGIMFCAIDISAQQPDIYNKLQDFHARGRNDSLADIIVKIEQGEYSLNKYSKSKKSNALQIIATYYLRKDEFDKTNKYIEKMLQTDPYYEHTGKESPIFEQLIKTVENKILPIYTLSLYASINRLNIQKISGISVLEIDTPPTPDYTGRSEFGAGLQFGSRLNKYWVVNTGLHYQRQAFSFTSEIQDSSEFNYSYEQLVSSIQVPLSLQFELPRMSLHTKNETQFYRGFRPFLEAGIYGNRLITASRNLTSNDQNKGMFTVNDLLNKYNIGVFAGVGNTFYYKQVFLSLAVMFETDIFKLYRETNRYLNSEQLDVFLSTYYDVPDNIRLQRMAIYVTLGYYLRYKRFD